MSKAINNFIRSVGLKPKFNTPDPITSIIPSQRFASDDNKFLFTAMYVCDKKFTADMVGDFVNEMDRLNDQGGFKFEYSTFEEIGGIGEKEWAQKLESYLPYEQRTAEVFAVIKSPLRCRGIKGNGLTICLATQDGYYVSFTELDTSDEVKDEDIEYLLSSQIVNDMLAWKK